MVCTIIGLGVGRFNSSIPLAASCSAAISAACHPPPGDDHAVKPVMWGEVPMKKANHSRRTSSEAGEEPTSHSNSTSDTRGCEPDGHDSSSDQRQWKGSHTHLLIESNRSRASSEDDEEATNGSESSLDTRSRQPDGEESRAHSLTENNGPGEECFAGYSHCSFSSQEVITPDPLRLYA